MLIAQRFSRVCTFAFLKDTDSVSFRPYRCEAMMELAVDSASVCAQLYAQNAREDCPAAECRALAYDTFTELLDDLQSPAGLTVDTFGLLAVISEEMGGAADASRKFDRLQETLPLSDGLLSETQDTFLDHAFAVCALTVAAVSAMYQGAGSN
jgi:hypothetical protein